MQEAEIIEEINATCSLIDVGEYQKALEMLKNLESENPNNNMIKLAKVGILIDAGFGLKDSKIIENGISTGEKLLKKLSDTDQIAKIYYNCANGYMALFKLRYDEEKDIHQIVDNEDLQKAKKNFRKALKEGASWDTLFKCKVWTNYGNCLSSLGRGLEALYAYDEALKINPEFSMALGNKAKAMLAFADISGVYRDITYVRTYQMLKSVVENEDVIEFGGNTAKESFASEIKRIEERYEDKSTLSKSIEEALYDISYTSPFEKFYIDFCLKHKLFLNFDIFGERGEASIADSVFIRLTLSPNDTNRFYELAKHINQIKEDYVTARLLLVQSQFKRKDFDSISKRTRFVNTMDYSMFNIYMGLLKSAFTGAYNILDKIARFIKEYYELGLKGNIYFHRDDMWQEGKNKEMKPKLLNSKNISLYALYDIYLDFKSKEYQKIRDIRNNLTHERLVIYKILLENTDEKYNIEYEEMLFTTIELFKLVKSAIIYLINFVEIEESKKRKNLSRPIPSIEVDTTQIL